MYRIMITGAGGQVGRCLIEAAQALPDVRVFAYTRSDMNIDEPAELREALEEAQPDLFFNCAAYTAVDKAESEAEKAEKINATATGRLAAACEQRGIRFIHFSSDYVYADRYNRPLREDDATMGNSVYARTKLHGEQLVLRHQPNSLILRTSWVYYKSGHNFVKTMIRLGREKKELRVVTDQVGSPTYAPDLAQAALDLALHPDQPKGIYNYSNAGVCSWYDFALAIHEMIGIDNCQVTPVNSDAYPTPAARPHYSLLDKSKISALLGPPRHWREALQECIGRIAEEG